ncbi:MAG: DNA-binding protein [Lachnospiraceae bacterium]|nr:DNA-binding protein [Lachnospiraceae bacterium]
MSSLKKEHTIEERLELSILYDFYGALLKDSQQRMFEASVLEDYNFSEIAEEEGITRQGVYDTVKRAIKQLRLYEEKLGLVARFRKQKELAGKLRSKLDRMNIPATDGEWAEVFQILEKVLEG